MDNATTPPTAPAMSERANSATTSSFTPRGSPSAYMQAREARQNALDAMAASLSAPDTPSTTPQRHAATPDSHTPPATAAVLAASSTLPATAQPAPKSRIARIPTTLLTTLFPAPVRAGWLALFAYLASFPVQHRILALIALLTLVVAELELPGFIPRPMRLTNGIVGVLCAGAVVGGGVAVLEWCEDGTWMWQEDGWVWPWERWMWGGSVGFDGEKSTMDTPGPFALKDWGSDGALGKGIGEQVEGPGGNESWGENAKESVEGTTTSQSPAPTTPSEPASPSTTSTPPTQQLIIPPTPLLPRGLRPISLPPPHPHHSGLLGASPQAPRFKHFSGDGFARTKDMMRVSNEWSKHAGGKLDRIWEGLRGEREGSGLIEFGEEGVEGEGVVIGGGVGAGDGDGTATLIDVGEDGSERQGLSALIEVDGESELWMSSANRPAGA